MPEKDRRRLRRKNHFSLDRDRDHSTRIIPNKKLNKDFDDYDFFIDDYYFTKQLGLTSKE